MTMSLEEVFEKLKSNSGNTCDEAVRILVTIADNVVKDPSNLKVRSLQKSNSTVQNKVLAIKGGSECLKLMGFQETDTSFILPSNVPVKKVEEVKNSLMNLKMNEARSKGAIPKVQPQPRVNNQNYEENYDDLDNVRRFILPPLTFRYSNPFLRRIEAHFHNALTFADKDCQKRAKKLIPLEKLEVNAQRNLRYIQMRIKQDKIQDPEFSAQDMLLLELLTWFKDDFFTWVDSPNCEFCGGATVMSHMSSDPKDLVYTNRVEVYKCEKCNKYTNFPRYNDLNILLETRRGRCGEWAQVFTLLCRSLNWDARYVVDELDHVWTEVYSITQKRWVHCDPCENACDTPLMYESGWNKKLTYVMAYSPDEVQDVTWRYTSNHREVLSRRKNCSEADLIAAIMALRGERQKAFSKAKQSYLTRRLVCELVELMMERKPNDNEKHGRISGSKEWRVARGEVKNENMYVWRIGDRHIFKDTLTIRYSTAADMYQFVKGDDSVMKVNDWSMGAFDFVNIFRKEEMDWKIVYLARNEGADKGSISWKYELEEKCSKVINSVSLSFGYRVYENGVVEIKLSSDDITVDYTQSQENFTTQVFAGKKYFVITANLSGGKGDVAWQHAQLFRQPMNSKEHPFIVTITFKDITR